MRKMHLRLMYISIILMWVFCMIISMIMIIRIIANIPELLLYARHYVLDVYCSITFSLLPCDDGNIFIPNL